MAPRRYVAPRVVPMSTKVSEPEAQLLDELAARLEVTRSSLVHQALRAYLREHADVPVEVDFVVEAVDLEGQGR